jgi:hypothetical protein
LSRRRISSKSLDWGKAGEKWEGNGKPSAVSSADARTEEKEEESSGVAVQVDGKFLSFSRFLLSFHRSDSIAMRSSSSREEDGQPRQHPAVVPCP